MADQRIVVHDPSHEVRDGTIVDGARTRVLESRRVVLLPHDVKDNARLGAVDGYFRRGWGAGWVFERMAGERGCPMVMGVSSQYPYLYWVARLAAESRGRELRPSGQLKLTTDSSTQRNLSGGLGAEVLCPQLESLGPPDGDGGWTVGGRSRLTIESTGIMSLCLWGVARDVVVIWSAVSQSNREVDLPWHRVGR